MKCVNYVERGCGIFLGKCVVLVRGGMMKRKWVNRLLVGEKRKVWMWKGMR